MTVSVFSNPNLSIYSYISIKFMTMEDKFCPKTPTCPLFKGTLLASSKAQEIYMSIYCKAGESGRMNCKRYRLAIRDISPPPDLMPNDKRSVEQIIAETEF